MTDLSAERLKTIRPLVKPLIKSLNDKDFNKYICDIVPLLTKYEGGSTLSAKQREQVVYSLIRIVIPRMNKTEFASFRNQMQNIFDDWTESDFKEGMKKKSDDVSGLIEKNDSKK